MWSSRIDLSAIASEKNEITRRRKGGGRVGSGLGDHIMQGFRGESRWYIENGNLDTYLLCKAPTTVSLPTFGNIADT
jgi:hypothetical protein